jgi:putative hydrolase of the HAD superfamily
VYRAVVFDLWQTLAVFPEDASAEFRNAWAESIGVRAERLDEHWYGHSVYARRESGPIRDAIEALYAELGVEADAELVLQSRLDLTRRALVPVDGAVDTLLELRRRGLRTGLISNCTEDVALVWGETPFAALFDAAVFSATAGCMKPDRRIYELALEELGVSGAESLFVGDGANDELRGACDVGMTPVLAELGGVEPPWPSVRDWSGLRVTAIPQVLDVVGVPGAASLFDE